MDFGHPQFTEAKILSEYIKTDAYRMAVRLAGWAAGVSCGTYLAQGRACRELR